MTHKIEENGFMQDIEIIGRNDLKELFISDCCWDMEFQQFKLRF